MNKKERWTKYNREHRVQQKQYRQDHEEEIKKQRKEYYQKLKLMVLAKLGNKCVRCGFSDVRTLQIDHVYGYGNKELRELGFNRSKFYKKVLADTEENYQLLCANCNWIKKSENKENCNQHGRI